MSAVSIHTSRIFMRLRCAIAIPPSAAFSPPALAPVRMSTSTRSNRVKHLSALMKASSSGVGERHRAMFVTVHRIILVRISIRRPSYWARCLVNPANMSWWFPGGGATATTPYVGVFGDSITVETQWGVPFDKTAHHLTDDLQAAGDASIVDAAIG